MKKLKLFKPCENLGKTLAEIQYEPIVSILEEAIEQDKRDWLDDLARMALMPEPK